MEEVSSTPLPDFDDPSDPVLPSRAPLGAPPPPPRPSATPISGSIPLEMPDSAGASIGPDLQIEETSESGPPMISPGDVEPPSMPGTPVIGLLAEEGSPEPTTPGYELQVDDGTSFDDVMPVVQEAKSNGAGAVPHDTMDYAAEEPGPSALPPQFPDVLRALEDASRPMPIPEPLSPASQPFPVPLPPPITSGLKHPSVPSLEIPRPRSGVQFTPMVLVVMILGLVALGMVIGILLTRV
jgi:hypothetical protein